MELTAVLRAISDIEGPVAIHSDSTYVVKCFNDRWYEGWKARGWKNSQKKPVANRDLWEPLIDLYLERPDEITFTWVKGHSGNELNEIADQLAVAEVDRLKNGLSAEKPVGEEIAVPWPVEQAIVVTGPRELDDDQRAELLGTVATLDADNEVIVSGLRLGAELEGAEAALDAGLPLGVVLPYPDPVRTWSPADRKRFDQACDGARWVVTLNGDPAKPAPSIANRNAWLWEAAVGAVVVGDERVVDQAEMAGLGVIAL